MCVDWLREASGMFKRRESTLRNALRTRERDMTSRMSTRREWHQRMPYEREEKISGMFRRRVVPWKMPNERELSSPEITQKPV